MSTCKDCLHYEVCECEDCLICVPEWVNKVEDFCGCFKPKADYVEVRYGYNKTSMHPVDEFWCSECGFCCADYTETKYDEDGDYTYSCECQFSYCPRCGAKMDGERKESEVRE
jgi:hypothetical protein